MSLSSSPGLPEEKYSIGGNNLGELLQEFRDTGNSVEALGGFAELCARIYCLVYGEDMTLVDALNELGRQSGGQLYCSRFWLDLSDGVSGEILCLGDDKIVGERLVTQLVNLKNRYLTENPEN